MGSPCEFLGARVDLYVGEEAVVVVGKSRERAVPGVVVGTGTVIIGIDSLVPTLVLAPNRSLSISLLEKLNGVILVGKSHQIPPKPSLPFVLVKPKLGPKVFSEVMAVAVGVSGKHIFDM